MELPEEPSSEDCCSSGCNPCIFDVYERQLKLYRCISEKDCAEEKVNGISELKYTTFKIVERILLCNSQRLIKFKTTNRNSPKVWWKPGDHFLYKYENESLSCTRAYTPFKLNAHVSEDFDFAIVVKCYKNGLVSNHLFNLKEDANTLWRGPYGSYKIKPNTFKRIIMIAQGTGIAPFITIIESILNDEDDMTCIILNYCCQSLDEVLFRSELNLYKSYWNFSYKIYLSNIPSTASIKYQEPITTRRLSYEDVIELKPFLNDQFLICGSSNFMKFYTDLLKQEDLLVENIVSF